MDWLEISGNALVIVLLLAILIVVLQLKNSLKHTMNAIRRDVESLRREVQADIHELRVENKEERVKETRAFASTRKIMLDNLDAIYQGVKNIAESKNNDSHRTNG